MTMPPPLKPLDILLYKGTDWSSRLIQFGTKSAYSHVAVVADPAIHLVVESNVGSQAGVRAVDLRKLDFRAIDVYRLKPEEERKLERPAVLSFLVGRLGARFDWAGVIWLGVLKLVGIVSGFRLQPYNAFQIDRDYFCSELCYEAFAQGGLDIVPQIGAAETTSPGDIGRSPLLTPISKSPDLHPQPL
jgi:uncharacterized protein YycO